MLHLPPPHGKYGRSEELCKSPLNLFTQVGSHNMEFTSLMSILNVYLPLVLQASTHRVIGIHRR